MVNRSANMALHLAEYHLIWCPKFRRRVLVGSFEARLRELVAQVAVEVGAEVVEVEVMPDHVHVAA